MAGDELRVAMLRADASDDEIDALVAELTKDATPGNPEAPPEES